MRYNRFAVFGGDERFEILANILASEGANVVSVLQDGNKLAPEVFRSDLTMALDKSDVLILPLPVSNDGNRINSTAGVLTLSDLISHLEEGKIILGGMVPGWFESECKIKNITCQDYFDREEFAVLNTIPTVEGCIEIAMHETKTTLHGLTVLVTGYGRIGKLLCYYLRNMGMNVYCAARKASDLAWIKAYGYYGITYDRLPYMAPSFDMIINTVPELVITKEVICVSKPQTLIIDLASKPGGVDFAAASARSIKAIHALSLPGKVAPVTAASAIYNTVLNILKEVS